MTDGNKSLAAVMERSCVASLIALALAITSGCRTFPSGTTRIHVPFIPQAEENHCGVTCLSMVFRHFNITLGMSKLGEEAFVPAISGSTPELLADVAEKYGLHATIRHVSLAEMELELNNGVLLIVFIPPAKERSIGHFILVTGISRNRGQMRAHDGNHRDQWLLATEKNYLSILLSVDENPGNSHPSK